MQVLRIADLSRTASRNNLAKADRATNLAKQARSMLQELHCRSSPRFLQDEQFELASFGIMLEGAWWVRRTNHMPSCSSGTKIKLVILELGSSCWQGSEKDGMQGLPRASISVDKGCALLMRQVEDDMARQKRQLSVLKERNTRLRAENADLKDKAALLDRMDLKQYSAGKSACMLEFTHLKIRETY